METIAEYAAMGPELPPQNSNDDALGDDYWHEEEYESDD